MDCKKLKKIVSEIASTLNYKSAFGGWYKQSNECIVVLELQKSQYGNLYYLNIKPFLDGFRENEYEISKKIFKNLPGNFPVRNPPGFETLLDLENNMSDEIRSSEINRVFKEFIDPYVDSLLTKKGIVMLYHNNQIFLFEPTKEFLNIKNS